MNRLYEHDFDKFYTQKIEPVLLPFEKKRASIDFQKRLGLIPLVFIIVTIMYMRINFIQEGPMVFVVIALTVFSLIESFYIWFLDSQFNKTFKKDVTSKILALFGNLYFSDKKNAVPYSDIQKWGLFPASTNKLEDDVIIGLHKGCNFLINECDIYHSRPEIDSNGNSQIRYIYDFKGLIIKIQMKKKFTGQTIVGETGKIKRQGRFEEVNLESISFMKRRKVYSTDQIEARYLLTTAFMERLDELADNFNYSSIDGNRLSDEERSARIAVSSILGDNSDSDVSAAFVGGFIYLFVPTKKDFFEVDTKKSLLNSKQFYNIYNEIFSILDIIEFLKLDKNLGL